MVWPTRSTPAVVAGSLVLLMAGLAGCMLLPVGGGGAGRLGAAALAHSLHLLLVAVPAAGFALLARRLGRRLAVWLFAASALLTTLMALWPAFALWRLGRQLEVPLSLGVYLENAARRNFGQPQPDRSVSYGVAHDGTELSLDVWLSGGPNTGPLHPAIVIVHGGAWTEGHRSMLPDWNRWLNELGYEVFDIEYRLSPPARWRDQVGDVKAALGWVVANAAKYHVDPARISLMGSSGGGSLALVAAYSAADPGLPPSTDVPPVVVRSVIDFYGPTDLIERVTPDSPPTFTVLGARDRLVPVEQATHLDQVLARAAVARETIILPATDHAFDVNWGGLATQIVRERLRIFLRRYS